MSATTAPGTTQFTIGAEVSGSDGVCGTLRRVIVDPGLRTVTHLAVEPKHERHPGRLVPIGLVQGAAGEIQLSCSMTEFEALGEADEIVLTPGAERPWAFGPGFGFGMGGGMGGIGMGGIGMGGIGLGGIGAGNMAPGPQAVESDLVPEGEVEVQGGDQVQATDGEIGRVQGLVASSSDHRVTGILLKEGHLWGQKRVIIPVSAVISVDDGVRLNLSKDQVRDLPSDESST